MDQPEPPGGETSPPTEPSAEHPTSPPDQAETPHEVVDLDTPPPGLPELSFPSVQEQTDSELAAAQRRKRIRTEIYGGGVLLVMGLVATVVFGIPQVLLLTALALGGVLAYELLVTSLQ